MWVRRTVDTREGVLFNIPNLDAANAFDPNFELGRV